MASLAQNHTLRAGLFMVAALVCFVFNDSCIKIIGSSLLLGEVMTVRGVFFRRADSRSLWLSRCVAGCGAGSRSIGFVAVEP